MWRKDPLLLLILWWTALVGGILVWLPLVRGATQGTAYRWALIDGIGGRGIGGAYWVLVPGAAFVLSLLFLGWRGGRQPFHWLLLGFHVPLAAAVTYAAWNEPQGFRFEGATIGLNVPLAVIGPVLFCGVAGAAILWVLRDLGAGRSRELAQWAWTRATRARMLLLVAILPLEVVMFRSGGIQSTQNMIGIALVGWQCRGPACYGRRSVRRQRTLALSALVVMSLSAMPAPAQDDADVRKELEAQYRRLAEAHDKKDLKAIVGLKTPDFHTIFPDGRVGDSKVMEQYSKQFLETNEPPFDIKVTIQKLSVSENKLIAVAEVFQEATRYRELDGRRRRIDTSVFQRETWAKTTDGWKLKSVDNVRDQKRFVDGKRVDPSKPYDPKAPPWKP